MERLRLKRRRKEKPALPRCRRSVFGTVKIAGKLWLELYKPSRGVPVARGDTYVAGDMMVERNGRCFIIPV